MFKKLTTLTFYKRIYSILIQVASTHKLMSASYLEVAKAAPSWESHITHKGRPRRRQRLIDYHTFTWECGLLLLLAFPKFL
jgi:hypothetical protein